jgi:DNA recombination protein RmuC
MGGITLLTLALAGLSAVLGLVALTAILRNRGGTAGISEKQISDLLRAETDRQRQTIDDQSRSLRQELADSSRDFQSAILKAFRELGDGLANRVNEFGARLDFGIKNIDDRVAALGTTLNNDIRQMGEDAAANRENLRQTIEVKLEDSSTKQVTSSRELRKEITDLVSRLQETLIKSAGDQRATLAEQFESFTRRLSESLLEINRRGEEVKGILGQSLKDLAAASDVRHQTLVGAMDAKLKDIAEGNLKSASAMRDEVATSLLRLGATIRETLTTMSDQQRERLVTFAASLNSLSAQHGKQQEELRQTVEGRLDAIRHETAAKLDEIRKTVDEQLQSTLNERITNSFKLVHDQLEQVHRGLGEMRQLADGVGDLKRVLTNVKSRGVFGEVQLGSLMEQMFSSDQYRQNAQIRDGSQERVEFALKIPGRSGEGEVLIAIDAKFPIEDYDRILQASERADSVAVEAAAAQLESSIRLSAKDISEKYINSPVTTDFAILFLPIEGLYAEVLRRPGLIESIQATYHVVISGPTTLLAMLSAFRMSIRAVAIQKRSTEVWQILGAVRTEFDNHGKVLGTLQRQLEASLNTVDKLGTRTRVMRRKLQNVDTIGAEKVEDVLGLPAPSEESDSDGDSDSEFVAN